VTQVTLLLKAASAGDPQAGEALLPVVYEELRQLARRRMANEPVGHTLQPTALVHEAYLRLVGGGDDQWENRKQFFGAAAQAMRRILIERARRYGRLKHGGDREREAFHEDGLAMGGRSPGAVDPVVDPAVDPAELLALNEALEELEVKDPRMAQIVLLRFFAGLGVEETAAAMDISPRTVKREWSVARLWLQNALQSNAGTHTGANLDSESATDTDTDSSRPADVGGGDARGCE